jgi:hypothetical protein
MAHRGGDLLDSFGTDLHRIKDQVKITLFSLSGRLVWQRRVFASDDLHVFECQAPGAGIWFVCLDGNCVKLVSLK